MNDIRFLPPCVPSKIIAVGLNYAEHIKEFDRTMSLPAGVVVPKEPLIFFKAPSAVIGLDEPIVLPKDAGRVDFEAELGVVIKERARYVSEADAMKHVLGFTCVNDVSAREFQKQDVQYARAKSCDTFAPVGPWIADELPHNNLRVESYVNRKPAQVGHTSQMIFSVPKLISFISRYMTLLPGDIISTGTPPGVGPLKAGDVIEIFVEGVGILRNSVIAEP